MFKLDKRLGAVLQFVPTGAVVADIGCDHGYLLAELVLCGRAQGGYACDINEKPLRQAAALIDKLGLTEQIETVLTSGVSGLPLEKIDTIVAAGMGGDLIARIIAAEPALQDPKYCLVLQPMSKPEHLRAYLAAAGFAVLQEQAAEEKGKMYSAIQVRFDGGAYTPTELELLVGKIPQAEGEENDRYLVTQRERLLKKLSGMQKKKNTTDEDIGEHRRVAALLKAVDEIIEGRPPCENWQKSTATSTK